MNARSRRRSVAVKHIGADEVEYRKEQLPIYGPKYVSLVGLLVIMLINRFQLSLTVPCDKKNYFDQK